MNKRGVSLVTLVLTIIILVILSGVIIVSINNNAVIDEANKATSKQNQAQAQQVASLAFAEKVMDGVEDLTQIRTYIEASLVANGYTLTDYNITVSEDGVNVVAKDSLIYDSNGNVQELVDGVPIPTGFVASSVKGENTKAGGLVIYEGTKSVTADNHAEALKTRNQFVWVPVEDMADFVRDDFDAVTLSETPGTGIWEIELGSNNKPKNTQDSDFITEETRKEAIAMYDSVEKYGGFYIARYEAGIGTINHGTEFYSGDDVFSVMGKVPYLRVIVRNSLTDDDGGAIEIARSLYPNTSANKTGVVSTLTYGVQFDTTINWLISSGAVSTDKDSTKGVYKDTAIANNQFNAGASYVLPDSGGSKINVDDQMSPVGASTEKISGDYWLLSTGGYKGSSLKNIYDLGGNIREVTMESNGTDYSVARNVGWNAGANYIYRRGITSDKLAVPSYTAGFRAALYIKD